jgi:Acetyltransferase (GNAT) domain
VLGRLATDNDRALLAAFCCARTAEEYEVEVEHWIQDEALDWFLTTPGARLLLFEDETSGALLGVSGHEPLPPPSEGRFVPVLGVALGAQAGGIGPRILFSVYEEAQVLCPGGWLIWKVDDRNQASQRMCEKLGFTTWTISAGQPYRQYVVDLP